jgi:hypothetical protein
MTGRTRNRCRHSDSACGVRSAVTSAPASERTGCCCAGCPDRRGDDAVRRNFPQSVFFQYSIADRRPRQAGVLGAPTNTRLPHAPPAGHWSLPTHLALVLVARAICFSEPASAAVYHFGRACPVTGRRDAAPPGAARVL